MSDASQRSQDGIAIISVVEGSTSVVEGSTSVVEGSTQPRDTLILEVPTVGHVRVSGGGGVRCRLPAGID